MSGEAVHFSCDDVEQRLVSRLREKRVNAGLSQTRLASQAGVSRSTISHMENGSSRPTLWVLLRIADALGMELWVELRGASENAASCNPEQT